VSSSSVETEIKIPVTDLERLRARLPAAGARAVSERHDEHNTLYDDDSGRLAAADKVLRLRKARGATLLTWKGPPRFDGGIRSREEVETGVEDARALERILDSLDLRPRFRYEKRREEFALHDCLIALDETPIGCFVEVEGTPDRIRTVLSDLALDAGEALIASYPSLYRRRRQTNPALPADMLFSR
jgi:adenylate cyclase class 2